MLAASERKSAMASDNPTSWSGSSCNLTWEYAGDYGWDTAGIAVDPIIFARYHEADLIHARWAMLGTLACVTPELLAKNADSFKADTQVLSDGGRDYLNNSSLLQAQSLRAILRFQMVLMSAVETPRVDGVPRVDQIDDFCNDGSCDLPDRFDDFWLSWTSTWWIMILWERSWMI